MSQGCYNSWTLNISTRARTFKLNYLFSGLAITELGRKRLRGKIDTKIELKLQFKFAFKFQGKSPEVGDDSLVLTGTRLWTVANWSIDYKQIIKNLKIMFCK